MNALVVRTHSNSSANIACLELIVGCHGSVEVPGLSITVELNLRGTLST